MAWGDIGKTLALDYVQQGGYSPILNLLRNIRARQLAERQFSQQLGLKVLTSALNVDPLTQMTKLRNALGLNRIESEYTSAIKNFMLDMIARKKLEDRKMSEDEFVAQIAAMMPSLDNLPPEYRDAYVQKIRDAYRAFTEGYSPYTTPQVTPEASQEDVKKWISSISKEIVGREPKKTNIRPRNKANFLGY